MNVGQAIKITETGIEQAYNALSELRKLAEEKFMKGESIESIELRQAVELVDAKQIEVAKIMGVETTDIHEANDIAFKAFSQLSNIDLFKEATISEFEFNGKEYEFTDFQEMPFELFTILSDLTNGYFEYENGNFIENIGLIKSEINFAFFPYYVAYLTKPKGFDYMDLVDTTKPNYLIQLKREVNKFISGQVELFHQLDFELCCEVMRFFLLNINNYKRSKPIYPVMVKVQN